MATLKNKIRYFRILRGYDKQRDFIDVLAKHGISITRGGLFLWEENRTQPMDAKKPKIAEALRVKPEELFYYDKEPVTA